MTTFNLKTLNTAVSRAAAITDKAIELTFKSKAINNGFIAELTASNATSQFVKQIMYSADKATTETIILDALVFSKSVSALSALGEETVTLSKEKDVVILSTAKASLKVPTLAEIAKFPKMDDDAICIEVKGTDFKTALKCIDYGTSTNAKDTRGKNIVFWFENQSLTIGAADGQKFAISTVKYQTNGNEKIATLGSDKIFAIDAQSVRRMVDYCDEETIRIWFTDKICTLANGSDVHQFLCKEEKLLSPALFKRIFTFDGEDISVNADEMTKALSVVTIGAKDVPIIGLNIESKVLSLTDAKGSFVELPISNEVSAHGFFNADLIKGAVSKIANKAIFKIASSEKPIEKLQIFSEHASFVIAPISEKLAKNIPSLHHPAVTPMVISEKATASSVTAPANTFEANDVEVKSTEAKGTETNAQETAVVTPEAPAGNETAMPAEVAEPIADVSAPIIENEDF